MINQIYIKYIESFRRGLIYFNQFMKKRCLMSHFNGEQDTSSNIRMRVW